MITNKLLPVKKSLINSKHGYALLELVITLTLLGIILSMGFMFYSFGVSTYRISEEQTDVQQNARLAADYIIKELRVAEKVIIVDGYEDLVIGQLGMTHDEDTPIYYLYLKDNSIYYQEHEDLSEGELPGQGANLAAVQESISANIDFELTFKKSDSEEDKDNIMEFDLSAINVASGRDYKLDTQLLVLNLDEIEVNNLSGDSGTALAYQVPAPAGTGIESVRIDPTNHVWENSGDIDIDVVVRTMNVPDDPDNKDVELEFFRREYDLQLTEVPGVNAQTSTIEDDKAYFRQPDAQPISIPKDLDYGYYYIRAAVDCLYEGDQYCDRNCGGLCLMQGRHYYVYADLWDLDEIKLLQGYPWFVEMDFKTGGVPVDREVMLGTEDMVADDYEGDPIEDIILLIYDTEKEEYLDKNIMEIPSEDNNNYADGPGELIFRIRFLDYDGRTAQSYKDEYKDKYLIFEFYIGLAEFSFDFNPEEITYYVLSDLVVKEDGSPLTLDPGFEQDITEYQLYLEIGTAEVTLEAVHNYDDVNMDLYVDEDEENKITEPTYELIEVVEVIGSYTKIEVKLVSQDGSEILNTYTINVHRDET